jgi:hypothetical protein
MKKMFLLVCLFIIAPILPAQKPAKTVKPAPDVSFQRIETEIARLHPESLILSAD